jgi:hypothetical protein
MNDVTSVTTKGSWVTTIMRTSGVRSGLVSRVVTHSELARALLAQPAVARPTDR